jgi:hypothetical protein
MKILVLDHQDVNDVLQNILNRLDAIEKKIGIKPAVDENTIAQLGITAKEFQNNLMQLAHSYNCIKGNYSVAEGYNSVASGAYSHAEGKMTPVENIKYRFKNGEYITEEDWSWLDKDDINE